MRQSAEDFVKLISKKVFNEKKWYDIEYYSPIEIVDMINTRYEIVFNHKWSLVTPDYSWRKIEIGNLWVEELWDTKWKKKLIETWSGPICNVLEAAYIYIISNKQWQKKKL